MEKYSTTPKTWSSTEETKLVFLETSITIHWGISKSQVKRRETQIKSQWRDIFRTTQKNYETNKILYNYILEIWIIDLFDFSDYKTSNTKKFRYLFIIFDKFPKYNWALPLKKEKNQTIPNEFRKSRTASKRRPIKKESDRGAEFYYNSISQNFL